MIINKGFFFGKLFVIMIISTLANIMRYGELLELVDERSINGT